MEEPLNSLQNLFGITTLCQHVVRAIFKYQITNVHQREVRFTFISFRLCGSLCEILASRHMGGEPGNVGTGTEGVFHLVTNANSPFARG